MKLVPLGDRVVLKQVEAGDHQVRDRPSRHGEGKAPAGKGYSGRSRNRRGEDGSGRGRCGHLLQVCGHGSEAG